MIRTTTLVAAAAALSACGSSPAPGPGVEPVALTANGSANSPIAGATLHCTGDYPDSRLVFSPDGTLSGRFSGEPVSGNWNALSPDRIKVLVRAGGITVRDTVQRTASGWRSENTSCG